MTKPMGAITTALVLGLLTLGAPLRAEAPLRDPALPAAKPEALEQLSDSRIRQQIMQASQAAFPGRCVCPLQTRDSAGRSCKGRYETIKARPRPLCQPGQVTEAMITEWRQRQPY